MLKAFQPSPSSPPPFSSLALDLLWAPYDLLLTLFPHHGLRLLDLLRRTNASHRLLPPIFRRHRHDSSRRRWGSKFLGGAAVLPLPELPIVLFVSRHDATTVAAVQTMDRKVLNGSTLSILYTRPPSSEISTSALPRPAALSSPAGPPLSPSSPTSAASAPSLLLLPTATPPP